MLTKVQGGPILHGCATFWAGRVESVGERLSMATSGQVSAEWRDLVMVSCEIDPLQFLD